MSVNQCGKLRRTIPSSFAQRGLSIVEVMLILVVVGLVLGASIVPFNELVNTDSYEREQRKINTARTAIIGYAANHRTTEITVFIIGAPAVVGDPPTRRPIVLPAGRPYLPCPDVDGDGYEDRQSFDVTGEVLTAPVDALEISATQNDLVLTGNCALSRGNLPWKTLGVPPADGWGNRYTYQVDDIYSNALVGFGQNSKVDEFDIRQLVAVNGDGKILFGRRQAGVINIVRDGNTHAFANNRRPSIVCGNLPVAFNGPAGIPCQPPARLTDNLPLVAGQRTILAFNAPRRTFAVGDVVEGVPYVLVSHGKNGRGAVNHVLSLDVGGQVCNTPVHRITPSAGNIAATRVDIGRIRHEVVNFPFLEGGQPNALRYCESINNYQDGHFVHQPRTNETFLGATNDNYDDIVVWMTGQELLQEMTRAEIFPVAFFPLLRTY